MAGQDYVPLFLPGCEPTLTAGANISAGQLVAVSADWTVSPTSGSSAVQHGVATRTVASGAQVAVWFKGIHPLATAATITAGQPVIAAASGGVAPYVKGTNDASEIVGYALAASANNTVPVHLL